MGTETKKMSRQLIGASMPPRTSPMNIPLNGRRLVDAHGHAPLFHRERVGQDGGRVRHQHGRPDPWKIRITINQIPAAWPDIHVTVRRSEKNVKTAKPRLYMRTRP
jgi:hypothetical protein